MSIVLPHIYGSALNDEISIWFYPGAFLSGLGIVLTLKYLKKKYSKEYNGAYSMSYTPKNKYGWYALIFFIVSMVLFYAYALLTKTVSLKKFLVEMVGFEPTCKKDTSRPFYDM